MTKRKSTRHTTTRTERGKTRAHKELFGHDSPYGHKVQKDKTKTIPRKSKHKNLKKIPPIKYEGPWSKDLV